MPPTEDNGLDQNADSDDNRGVEEVIRKVEGGLLPAIENHLNSKEFHASRDSFDFWRVKNDMMLTYLIELIRHKRNGNNNNLEKLTELKIALEKIRPLEKKMRYQLDKLLSITTHAGSFATASSDPLAHKPNPDAFKDDDSEEDDSENDENDEDGDQEGEDESEVDEDEDNEDGDMDDDLAAARATLALAQNKRKSKQKDDDEDGDVDDEDHDGDSIYRAPRLSAVPFPDSSKTADLEQKRRRQRRLRASELAQTLREQYGDAPEQEDVHGGTAFGQQREKSRRFQERQLEKTKYEEESMIRLTTSRAEKKERRRLMREESSNLAAISDLGNLVRGVHDAFGEEGDNDDYGPRVPMDDTERRPNKKRRGAKKGARNELQKELFGGGGGKKKSKKKRR